ncbi:MAG: hydantoinase/oxoprolinase family protein, partial [Gammaproteobacteria bacterium]
LDPRDYVLTSFGGAGGLHVCALAEALGMRRALVPVQAGVLSALGMLVAAPSRELSRTLSRRLDRCQSQDIDAEFHQLEQQARQEMASEIQGHKLHIQYSVDLRYLGQSFTLNLPWQEASALTGAFHELHRERYGHDLQAPVELVNVRVSVAGEAPPFALSTLSAQESAAVAIRQVRLHGVSSPVNVYIRDQLKPGQVLNGPALIVETISTTFVEPGWCCQPDGYGNLLLSKV